MSETSTERVKSFRLRKAAATTEQEQAAREFVHVARYLMLEKGSWYGASMTAKQARALPRIQELIDAVKDQSGSIFKTATSVGTTTDNTWASPLAQYAPLADGFLASLRNQSAFDTLLPSMRNVPLGLQNVAVCSGGATASTINENMVKPVSKLSFTSASLTPLKTVAIIVVTSELLKFTNVNLLQDELTKAVAEAVDTSFVAELSSGISPTTSSGDTAASILIDLAAALNALSLTPTSKVFLLVDSAIAKHWSVAQTSSNELLFPGMTPTGGVIQGMPVIVTNGVVQQIIAVDASQITAMNGTIELDAANQASLELNTTPDSPQAATTALVSLFQQNWTGLRATRFWAIERLRTAAVSIVGSVDYGSANSPA